MVSPGENLSFSPFTERHSMTIERPTELRNSATIDIDTLPAGEAVALILREDVVAVNAAVAVAPAIGELAERAAEWLGVGGHLHYFGAGASGRLAVLDATEITPTFGAPRSLVVAHFPGGTPALVDSTIDLEDGLELGEQDAADVTATDVVVGVTASGTTRYVEGALRAARDRGAYTALITSNPNSSIAVLADIVIVLDTGPEALTGSTRLKAGTAAKVALNALSTAIMIRLGRTYSNLMIGMSVTNEKLGERAVALLSEATGASEAASSEALAAADQNIPRALVAMLTGADSDDAERALAQHTTVRAAVAAIASGEL